MTIVNSVRTQTSLFVSCKELIVVVAQLQRDNRLIVSFCRIVGHFVYRQQAVIGPVTVQVYLVRVGCGSIKLKMSQDIIARRIYLDIIRVAYQKCTISILVINIIP